MLVAGKYHNLKVNRVSDYGLYLCDEEEEEVLLPNRYVSLEYKVGDMIDVFIYYDSEDRIVASTEKPLAAAGEVAFLEVVDKTIHGAFLDWGLEAKHLFLPNRNMKTPVIAGRNYIVYVYTDNVTGRPVATAKINGYVNNEEIAVKPRQEVDIIIAQENEFGYRVIINNRNWGMLYRNQIFRPVAIGDELKAYVTKITEDNRIDVSLQQQGYDEVKKSAETLLEIVRKNGGTLPLGDNSDPIDVTDMTRMSKKVFKRAAGYLMKRGDIELSPNEIKLKKK